ncbi:MAG: alpha/beta hydrolase [Pararhodobacter sp.]
MTRPFTQEPILSPLLPLALIAAALAFTTALTPSLIPRAGAMQGALAGAAFMAVYWLGAVLAGLWRWLGLPQWRPRWLLWAGHGVALVIIIYGLTRVTDWQNAVNAAAGMPPVETARPFTISGVALMIIVPLIILGRLLRILVLAKANQLARFLPARLALAGALITTAALFWMVGNGVLGGAVLRGLDSAAQQVDSLIPDDLPPPAEPTRSGSSESFLAWDSLGAAGRRFVTGFPDRAQIEALTPTPPDGTPAQTPVRVYVGLNSAETPEERAALALAELIRTEAFSRNVLVIATPTGTGFVQPASLSTLEFLWRGDVASVSVQYSYLASWLTLLVDPDYGVETARAVFREIHDYWRTLPAETRPRLYLHGLSLGSLNSELSADVWELLAAPHNGAFWVGPTFANTLWQDFTARRNPGTPAWRPVVGRGSLVRFATQDGMPDHGTQPWGPVRILYLQYPSDAISFFSPESLWRKPDWLSPRAPDVSPAFRWVPVVSFLQLLADFVAAFRTPVGVGHAYAARHYMDGWYALTEPPGWAPQQLEALRAWYADRGL